MRLYTVYLPRAGVAGPALDDAVFVRDGFHVWAFLFGVLWCLWRGLWLPALALVVLRCLVFGLGYLLGLSPTAQVLAQLVISLFVGIEAPDLRRWALRRRGHAEAGTVAAADLADAERRFFTGADAAPVRPANVAPSVAAPPGPRPASDGVIGLFPEPGGR
jgi:hypothetical protein